MPDVPRPAHQLANGDGTSIPHGYEVLLKASDVAMIFKVNPRTVNNWTREGKLRFYKTPTGQYRYPEDSVRALYEGRLEDARTVPEEPVHIIVHAEPKKKSR